MCCSAESYGLCIGSRGAATDLVRHARPGCLLLTLAALGAFGMWLVLIGLVRREETAIDATAARVFGEVLTVAGVERIRHNKGALSRCVPTLLRSHPDPAARRRAGLAGRPDMDR